MSQTSIAQWEPISRALRIEDKDLLVPEILRFQQQEACVEALELAIDQDLVKNKEVERIMNQLDEETDFHVCLIDGKLYYLVHSLIHQRVCGFMTRRFIEFFDDSVEVLPG